MHIASVGDAFSWFYFMRRKGKGGKMFCLKTGEKTTVPRLAFLGPCVVKKKKRKSFLPRKQKAEEGG